jgi:PKD repeat protein
VAVLAAYTSTILAEQDQIITDAIDDVIYTDASDLTGESSEEIKYTSERPTVDITKMTYIHPDNSKQATLILEVKGVIENRNDLDTENFNESDFDSLDFSGSMVSYFMELETSYSAYQIEYVNETCNVNEQTASFDVEGSELTITFDLETTNETFESIIGYTTEINIVSLLDMRLYMDIAPNDALFLASINAPYTGDTGASVTFSGEYDDFLVLTQSPYTYSWDWDDGTPMGSGKNPTHTYQYPGQYTVILTIKDSTDYTSTASHTITISQGSGNNGDGSNNNGDTTDNDGSGLTLFILVVVIIVIIGIIALVVVIRR